MKGSFYKRGSTWSYMIDIGIDPLSGKRKQKSKGGFKTKKEAQLAAAELISEMNKGQYVAENKMTFEELANDWLINYKRLGKPKKEGTIRIRNVEKNLLLPFFKMKKAMDITHNDYQDSLITLMEGQFDSEGNTIKKGLADNTMSGVHATASMIFKHGVKIGAVKKDPTIDAKVPKKAKTVKDLEDNTDLPEYLERDELLLFLETVKEYGLENDYETFNTLAYTGIRVGELCALKETDVNFEENKIRITKTLYNPENNYKKYSLVTPKTVSSFREIDVDEEVMDMIKNLIKLHKIEKEKRSNSYHDEGFVFARVGAFAGYPEIPKKVGLRMARLIKLANLNTNLTPHSLRHTHASLLAEAGATLEQIMHRLGHANDEITRRIYLHITKPKRKEAAQKFSELMKASKKMD
ncbi:site-specific integrase [Paenibacillus xylanexedens]|uniref:site-specific integrase n=1 Tax=Paenibacillus xylanexedens TaxID=528191 RepID=UPI0021B69FD7|nr:site-specific integrase [Paenibacillus xylanexedens]